jgi:flagellar hook-associated protein 2
VTSSSSASLVVNGIISGINTPQVIQALLAGYTAPITDLQNQQTSLQTTASDYKTINTDMQSLLTAARALNTPSQWNLTSATTSTPSVATATSGAGAQTGTTSFTVNALAQGNVLVSKGGAASLSAPVTTAPSLLVATGGAALGFAGLSGGAGLGLGAHSITVDQSSSAATVAGTSPLSPSTTITAGVNDTLDLTADGTPYVLTIAPGSYATPAALAAAVTQAANAAGAPVTATVTAGGELSLATAEQGSAATLTASGGNALATLGLTSGATATGSDAIVEVDGTKTTLTSVTAGSTVTLGAPSGSITAQITSTPDPTGSLVSKGSASSALVSTGSGDLNDLLFGINNAGLSLTASAVQDSSGAYRLQVSASQTGLVGAASVDASSFSAGPLASLSTITAAQDASVSVGGADGYSLTSSTNTFSNLLAGTAITVVSQGNATVTVGQDPAGEANAVKGLVDAANQALGDINSLTAFNATTKTGGPLMGSAIVQNLKNEIASIFASAGGTSGLGNVANVGIALNSDGTLTFNQATFQTAFAANPNTVTSLFTQGTTFAPANPAYTGSVNLLLAGDASASGSYDVTISQSAAHASDLGAVLAGGVAPADETLTVASGSSTGSYTINAGESLANVAAGLNGAFAANNLSLTATVVNGGSQLQVISDGYGSAQQFTLSSSLSASAGSGLGGTNAGDVASFAGVDVAGSINGVAATGTGQVLAAPLDDPILNGLSTVVTATGITTPTDLGTLTYSPGVAQQLVSAASLATNPTTGTLTTTINGINAEATGLNPQIANLQALETSQQDVLQKEFSNMETTLGQLKSESSSLASAISGLPPTA